MALSMEMASKMALLMEMVAWWFLVRFYLCPSGEDVVLPTSAHVVRM